MTDFAQAFQMRCNEIGRWLVKLSRPIVQRLFWCVEFIR